MAAALGVGFSNNKQPPPSWEPRIEQQCVMVRAARVLSRLPRLAPHNRAHASARTRASSCSGVGAGLARATAEVCGVAEAQLGRAPRRRHVVDELLCHQQDSIFDGPAHATHARNLRRMVPRCAVLCGAAQAAESAVSPLGFQLAVPRFSKRVDARGDAERLDGVGAVVGHGVVDRRVDLGQLRVQRHYQLSPQQHGAPTRRSGPSEQHHARARTHVVLSQKQTAVCGGARTAIIHFGACGVERPRLGHLHSHNRVRSGQETLLASAAVLVCRSRIRMLP
eukprot:3632582-Rhodomonas_salina.4